jgi:hypothetical protein
MTNKLFNCAIIFLMLFLAGCDEKDKYTLKFSHTLHVKENGMSCSDCHGDVKDGRLAWPGHKVCADCHGDMIETNEISAKTCGVCHKEKNLNDIAKRPEYAAAAPGVFTHTAALKTECASCHAYMLAPDQDYVPKTSRSDIIMIRQKSHESGRSCDTCHSNMSPLVPPASHKKDWTRRHGSEANAPDAVCSVCHHEETCRECHETNKPLSHNNNLWRLKTHGIEASWERAKCRVCHEVDFCVECHSQTRPLSHNAAWRGTHCQNCHTSQEMGTGCVTCHFEGIAEHPDPHAAGWKNQHCNQCHPGSPEWNQCILCHTEGIGGHPDPHSAGWLNQHCNQCHADTLQDDNCLICHAQGLGGHPDPHAAGWLSQHCNQCHVDTLQNLCVICHAQGLNGHPDPHPAGWQLQHCSQCHAGQSGNPCATCHAADVASHPDPHPLSWLNGHCASCHQSGDSSCNQCHVAGTLLTYHVAVWDPSLHAGFTAQTDCFQAGCHDTGNARSKKKIIHAATPAKGHK